MSDFISLHHTLVKIARHIEVSDDDIDYYAAQTSGIDDPGQIYLACTLEEEQAVPGHLFLMANKYQGAFETCKVCTRDIFRLSRAAMKLLNLLFHFPVELDWYDKSEIGEYLLAPEARDEGCEILVELSKREIEIRSDLSLNQIASRWDIDTVNSNTIICGAKLPRRWDIGFDREKIFNILIDYKVIPASPVVVRTKPRFRGELGQILDEVVRTVDNPDSVDEVWAALSKAALEGRYPHTVTGFCSKRGILYRSYDLNEEEQEGALSKTMLKKRLKRRTQSV